MGPILKKQKLNKGNAKEGKVEVKEVEKAVNTKNTKKVQPEISAKSDEESDEESDVASDKSDEEEFEELDDLDLDDEVEVDDVSSGESGDSNSESESDYDEDLPKLKKKKNLDDGSKSFANAFSAIVNSKLKAYDRKDPILARSKVTLKKFDQDKLDAKARRLLLADKKVSHDNHRIKNLMASSTEPERVRELLQAERDLKKTAQKGVVRLFNAVLSTQVKTTEALTSEIGGESRKDELMNEISKEKFLDLVQLAGE